MAIELSITAQNLSKNININPQVILDIEGVDLIFGAQPILKVGQWDDEGIAWDDGTNWDSLVKDARSRDWIDFSGTTKNISQQINPDKSGSTSISTVNVQLIDKDGELSRALSFDAIGEIIGRRGKFSIGFKQGAYPEDAIPVFNGAIVDFYTDSGTIMLTMTHPDQLKKQSYLDQYNSELTADIDSSQTTIDVVKTDNLITKKDTFKTYIKIDEELMEVTAVNSLTQLQVIRGQLNTIATSADSETEAVSFYRMQDKPLDLALKIMLSNDGNEPFESLDIPSSIEFASLSESIENAVIFDYFDIEDKTGLVVGDTIMLDSPSNTGTYTVASFVKRDDGRSYIITNEDLVSETEYVGTFYYNSKYNVYPNNAGLGMLSSEVDIKQFEEIGNFFSSNFVEYDFYIKDSIDSAKEFLDSQVFFPQGLYSIPRKARSSVKYVTPPFSNEIAEKVSVDQITNITKVKQRRSAHKYLYNTYVYKFNSDSIEDKYLANNITVSADSFSRIPLGRKKYEIKSDGLRNNPSTINTIESTAQRLIDRYRFAPTYFEGIEVKYKDGIALEVGDVIPFGDESMNLTNLNSGTKQFKTELYEVTNKSLNVENGNIKINLLQTAFEINARYGVFSIGSGIGVGSTSDRIIVTNIVETNEYLHERQKWASFVGYTIRVRTNDYTIDETTTIKALDSNTNNGIILDPPLSFTPTTDMIAEVPEYDDSSPEINEQYKLQFAHMVAKTEITSVLDNKTFDVLEPEKLVVGSNIVVNAPDFTRDSFGSEFEIVDITGNTITLNDYLLFVPIVGDLINRSSFKDNGAPYVLI